MIGEFHPSGTMPWLRACDLTGPSAYVKEIREKTGAIRKRPEAREKRQAEATLRTARKRTVPFIIASSARGASRKGNRSIIGRTPCLAAKASASLESAADPEAQPCTRALREIRSTAPTWTGSNHSWDG